MAGRTGATGRFVTAPGSRHDGKMRPLLKPLILFLCLAQPVAAQELRGHGGPVRAIAVAPDGVPTVAYYANEVLSIGDRDVMRMVGLHHEQMRIVVVKSSNHFRADFTPIASRVLVAKAAGPMAADPADLPWTKLSPQTRTRP